MFGEFGIEARAQLQQRGHAATNVDLTNRGRERAAQDLQQRAFAGAVTADDTDGLAYPKANWSEYWGFR